MVSETIAILIFNTSKRISNHINANGNCEVPLTIKNWAMMQCNMSFCASKDLHNHNGRIMVLFTASKKPKERVRRGKDGECNNKKNSIKWCQNEAWTCAINHGHTNGSVGCSDNARHRTWFHRFHSIVIACDSNDRHRLKTGVDPAMCLSQHAVENELYK